MYCWAGRDTAVASQTPPFPKCPLTGHAPQMPLPASPPNAWVSRATAKPLTPWARPAEQPMPSQAQNVAAVASAATTHEGSLISLGRNSDIGGFARCFLAPLVGRAGARPQPTPRLFYNTTSPDVCRKYYSNLCRPTAGVTRRTAKPTPYLSNTLQRFGRVDILSGGTVHNLLTASDQAPTERVCRCPLPTETQ
jgi:hypothetical protein